MGIRNQIIFLLLVPEDQQILGGSDVPKCLSSRKSEESGEHTSKATGYSPGQLPRTVEIVP
jgi:hypothetical protein